MGIISNMLRNAKDKEIAQLEYQLQQQKMQRDAQMELIKLMQQGVVKPNNPEEYMRAKAGQYQETTMPGVGAIMVPPVQQQQQVDPRQQIQALMQGLQRPSTPNADMIQPRIKGITAKLGDNLSANIEIPETDAMIDREVDVIKKKKSAEESAKLPSQEVSKAINGLETATDAWSKMRSIITQPDFDWGLLGGAIVSSGNPTLATLKDPKIKEIQTQLNRMKPSLMFGEGGKALTGTEKKLVEVTLNPTGKTPTEYIKQMDQIIADKKRMLSKLQNKKNVVNDSNLDDATINDILGL